MIEHDPASVRFTASGLGLRIEGQIAPDLNVTLEQHIDATADQRDIDELLDRMTRAFWRQQAHPRLIEALIDLKARQETIATLPHRLQEFDKAAAAQALTVKAAYEARHGMAMLGKRNPVAFVNWPLHAEMIEQLRLHEENTQKRRGELIAEAEKYKTELPLIEQRVARQQAILDGADRASTILEARQAAE